VPKFVLAGANLELVPDPSDVTVNSWEFEVISGGPFPPAIDAYLRSEGFRNRLQDAIRFIIRIGQLGIPPIDASPLAGILATADPVAPARVDNGVLMIGLNIHSGDEEIVGEPMQLADFAGDHNVAIVVNPEALPFLFADRRVEVEERVAKGGGTLRSLEVTAESERIRIVAAVRKGQATANIRLALVPTLFAGRPGAYLAFRKHTQIVRGRAWPALGFSVEDVELDVDVDFAAWRYLLLGAFISPLGAALVYLFARLALEEEVAQAKSRVAVEGEEPVPRVQRSLEPDGTKLRIELARYAISPAGIYIGVEIDSRPPQPMLTGPLSIPGDPQMKALTYTAHLPAGVHPEDPALRLRWTVIDVGSGAVLDNQDAPAAGRLSYGLVPETVGPGLPRLKIVCRVYRALGAETTDLLNGTITLQIRAPAPPGVYVRWHSEVKNPQVRFDGEQWTYDNPAEAHVRRRSKIHRTDKPCANAANRSRYSFEDEVMDALPFDVAKIDEHRSLLCDYCFFGGPAGTRPEL
jgi:hypothetical protein